MSHFNDDDPPECSVSSLSPIREDCEQSLLAEEPTSIEEGDLSTAKEQYRLDRYVNDTVFETIDLKDDNVFFEPELLNQQHRSTSKTRTCLLGHLTDGQIQHTPMAYIKPEPLTCELTPSRSVSKRQERGLFGLVACAMIIESIAMAVTISMVNTRAFYRECALGGIKFTWNPLPVVATLFLMSAGVNAVTFFWPTIKARWRQECKSTNPQMMASTTTVVSKMSWLKYILLGGGISMYTMFNLGVQETERVVLMNVIVVIVFLGPSYLQNNKIYQMTPALLAWVVYMSYVLGHVFIHKVTSDRYDHMWVHLEPSHVLLSSHILLCVVLPTIIITIPGCIYVLGFINPLRHYRYARDMAYIATEMSMVCCIMMLVVLPN